jgi:signal transduction histidine kinase/CheY-like chemotaxis protein
MIGESPFPFAAPDSVATALMRDLDWSALPLGERASLPSSFRIALMTILAAPEAMYLVWGPERRLFFNDAYIPLLGNKLDGAMGERFEKVWWDVWDDVRQSVEATFAGGSHRFVDRPLKMDRDGELRETFWTFSFSPFRDETGSVVALLCVTTEQTTRIRENEGRDTREAAMAIDLASVEEQLRQSQKLEAIGQLTGGVAHDFNNLLTVIRGSVDLLRRDKISADRRVHYLEAIGDAADRAAALTAQLLAFARKQALKPEIFDVGGSIALTADIVRTLAGSRIQVEFSAPKQEVFALADRGQLDTAIINMAINARDAMDGEGKIVIAVGPVSGMPEIRTHEAVAGDFVAITITDFGTGIAPDQVSRIFEPFYTTKAVGEGTGLGLSQVFGFAKQSGGDIRVESVEGKGSTFILYLPRVYQDVAIAGPEELETRFAGEGLCVLVVEDNRNVGEFATEALRALGYNSILAHDAEEALGKLGQDCGRYHVVFSDIVMPGMNGLELGERIRRDYPNVPVVLTSGYSHVLAQNGQHGFELLHKPYSVEQLSRVLGKAIAWHRRRIAG